MQIVIDIDDESYKEICLFAVSNAEMAIKKGIILPKGHGDLIDRSELYNQTASWESQALEQVGKYNPMYSRDDWRWWTAVLKERGAFKHDVADAKTIVPADKESEGE